MSGKPQIVKVWDRAVSDLKRRNAIAERMVALDGISVDDAWEIIKWCTESYGMTLEEMERTLDEQLG